MRENGGSEETRHQIEGDAIAKRGDAPLSLALLSPSPQFHLGIPKINQILKKKNSNSISEKKNYKNNTIQDKTIKYNAIQ